MVTSQRASALVITLLLIALITILLVGFFTTVRMEANASRSHLDGVRASTYAQMGSDAALARLIVAASSTGTNLLWTSSPGQIVAGGTSFPLYSGTNTNVSDSANLNAPGLEDVTMRAIATVNFFTNTNAPAMRMQWVYVNKNGTFEASSSTNTVGRFAFWVDDDSSRVNVNTAWKRGNSNPKSHPSQVDLPTLGFTDSDAVHNNQPYNTISEAQRFTLPANVVATNSFQLTSYNHSPELSVFNEPRILLTTQKSVAGGNTNFIDILTVDNTDPGQIANINAAKVNAQVNKLASLLKRTGWPLPDLASKSLADKYAPLSPHQLALDIIEYVRSYESPQRCVEPLRGTVASGSFQYLPDPVTPDGIAGNTRGARITEFGVFVSKDPLSTWAGRPHYLVRLKAEVYLPPGSGIASLDLSQYTVNPVVFYTGNDYMSLAYTSVTPISATVQPLPVPLKAFSTPYVESGGTVMAAGESRVIVMDTRFDVDPPADRSKVTIVKLRLVFRRAYTSTASARLDLIPTLNEALPYTKDADTVAEANMTTRSVDDPSINKAMLDWRAASVNTFGTTNAGTLGTTSTAIPQQDTDSAGRITDAGMKFPPPKGQPGNVSGVMQSVAELGHVHSGLHTISLTQAGVPWRTVRLQPQSPVSNLPDWALLDLFQVPRQSPTTFADAPLVNSPVYDSIGGKVNLQTKVLPFDLVMTRTAPLRAVFRNATNGLGTLSDAEADTIVTNISQTNLATGGSLYGMTNYITPGQITEILNVADRGEASEELLRNTIDHLTTRSGVFSIYAVGQSIRQAPDGRVTVLGERRSRMSVERVQETSGQPATFRMVASDSLNP